VPGLRDRSSHAPASRRCPADRAPCRGNLPGAAGHHPRVTAKRRCPSGIVITAAFSPAPRYGRRVSTLPARAPSGCATTARCPTWWRRRVCDRRGFCSEVFCNGTTARLVSCAKAAVCTPGWSPKTGFVGNFWRCERKDKHSASSRVRPARCSYSARRPACITGSLVFGTFRFWLHDY
jgi:hypothetical protein